MYHRSKILRRGIDIVVLVALLLSLPGTSVLPILVQAREAQPELEPVPNMATEPAPAATIGLFRTRVALRQPTSRARLDELGIVVLDDGEDWAVVLVDDEQLETLARLRFEPQASDDVAQVWSRHQDSVPYLASTLTPLLAQVAQVAEASETDTATEKQARDDLHAALHDLTSMQQVGILSLPSDDDDADGLTNTQEQWWCTDPLDPDSDGDGATDGVEVQAAKDWVGNFVASYPATGKPFVGWPPDHVGCYDDDHDSIPDLAERWELGLNMNRESTDRDKFDDGQEVFGNTYCPGSGGYCGYGSLPRDGDWGIVFAEMPSWVEKPGNHPFAAAFPVPEIDVVESSLHVETVTEVATDHVIAEGTEESYSTAKTEGISTSIADTVTWNEWQEVAHTSEDQSDASGIQAEPITLVALGLGAAKFVGQKCYVDGAIELLSGESRTTCEKIYDNRQNIKHSLVTGAKVAVGEFGIDPDQDLLQNIWGVSKCVINEGLPFTPSCLANGVLTGGEAFFNDLRIRNANNSQEDGEQIIEQEGMYLVQSAYDTTAYPKIDISIPAQHTGFVPTKTESHGNSWGGSQTTTNTEYEEHTVTNGEAFSTEESWGTATAVDSAHAADLWFTYQVRNMGTEYAREIGDLAFNIYLGDDPNPIHTYFVAPDVGGDGKFHNFMPGEEHEYASQRIPLSLEQMKVLDLGSSLRIVVEDYSYGIDELFYEDAVNSNVLLAMEDSTADGDESIDHYLIPTWDEETILDVVARYFPHTTDADGTMIAIWTPEYRADTPAWCAEPRRVGATLWCQHALSTADWWNVYTNGLGDGTEGFQDTVAAPGSTALFRFNKDTDLDGYSDRSEARLGTDPADPASHPQPELLAGLHTIREDDYVTATLSLLNTGFYDAYGVEAVMIAPNDTISITNNTVGGSGRVRALRDVVVGSRILPASHDAASWHGDAQPFSAGYYTGAIDRVYTFTALDSSEVSSNTLRLAWHDGLGVSGTLACGAGYASPTPLDVGGYGVQVGLLSGEVQAGDVFSVTARTPRDTFQYAINAEPHTPPVVLVSYNDPQGNHRFVTPVTLTTPTEDLVPYSGQMLEEFGVEIVTQAPITATGTHTTNLVVNWPVAVTLEDAHLFLEFINISGTVASEVPVTVTVAPGPNVVPVTWDTSAFSPTFQADEDYIVLAFWTDWQGNILDTAGRPLSSFQEDPKPTFAMAPDDVTWDFGTARQGTLMQRQFELANVGYMDLLTYLGEVTGVMVAGPASGAVLPADMAVYTVTLNTEYLPVGAFEETIPIRTSDPANPTQTVTILGEVLPFTPDSTQDVTLRPLDWAATIPGDHSQGEWVTFTHTLGPDPETLHPIKVYDEDYTTLWGVGKYTTYRGEGVSSWWNRQYLYRSQISILAKGATPSNYPVQLTLDLTTLQMDGKLRADYRDLRVAYWTGSGWLEIDRYIDSDSTVWFATVSPIEMGSIDSDYYVYYGNLSESLLPPQDPTGVFAPQNDSASKVLFYWLENTGTSSDNHAATNAQYTSIGVDALWAGSSGRYFGGIFLPGTGCNTGWITPNTVPNLSSITIEAWLYPTRVDGQERWILEKGNEADHYQYAVVQGADNHWRFGLTSNPSYWRSWWDTNVPVTPNVWSHIAFTYDASNGDVKFYLNGVLAASSRLGWSGGLAMTNYAFHVGKIHNMNHPNPPTCGSIWSGYISSLHISSSVRNSFPHATLVPATDPQSTVRPEESYYIAEQIEIVPYNSARLFLPEFFTGGQTYAVKYGRRYTFSSAGEQTLHIRIPKQLYTSLSLDALLSNTGVSSGDLNLTLDVGNDGINDWTHNATTDFPVTFVITDVVDSLNAYLVSRTDVAWDADVDVPVRVTSNRQADVILTNLELRLQYNQPAGLLSEVDTSADRPLDWNAYIAGNHSQGEWITFTHTLGPETQSLHPVKVFSYDHATLWGVGKYATDFGEGTASYEMFGDGRDGELTVNSSQTYYTDNVRRSIVDGASVGQNVVTVVDTSGFSTGDIVIIHQTRGDGAGNWEIGTISNVVGDDLVLTDNLDHSYLDGSNNNQVQVLRVPQFSDCHIHPGGFLTAHSWDGDVGGILAFLCNATLIVEGTVTATGIGYRAHVMVNNDDRAGVPTGACTGSPTFQGEGTVGALGISRISNGNGGGGGLAEGSVYNAKCQSGGGGGGNGTSGERVDQGGNESPNCSPQAGGEGGLISGNESLTNMVFGGSGGRGGPQNNTQPGYHGGNGGGITFLAASVISVTGSIENNGNDNEMGDAPSPPYKSARGGGGAGGSVLIRGGAVSLGLSGIQASGGSGGVQGGYGGRGGNGGQGRIRIEYCDTLSGATNPVSSTQKLDCYAIEQVESSPYDTTRLNLPESFTDGQTYAIQYGRRYVFPSADEQTSYLRLRRQMYGSVSLDALVSNTDVSNGMLDLCLDIGDNGTCDYTHNASIDFPAELVAADLASALNDYLVSRSDIAWGDPVGVPVRVAINRQADVILTNLALNPVGTKTRYLRLPAQDYADLHVSLQFTQPGVPNGPLAFAVDIGADGDTDWYYSGTPDFPAILASPNLAGAFNTYLAGRSGDVDVPLRIIPNPFIDTALYGMTAIPVETPDATLTAADITFGAPVATEGEHVPVSLTLHNTGGLDTAGLTAAFFAEAPGWGEWYVGSAYVPSVPAGLTATTTITWNTLGFTGTVPVRVVVDPYDRVSELDEENNEATTTFDVRTRPDLLVEEIALSDAEPMAGETVTVTLTLRNQGQTMSVEQTLSLYEGNPDDGGTAIAQLVQPSLTGGLTATVPIAWAPPDPGPYRLFVVVDEDDAVDEYDEGNNIEWWDTYAGFTSPLLLDSGTAGDAAYLTETGFGVVDQGSPDVLPTCGAGDAAHETLRLDPDGEVIYRFDHLLPGHAYHLDVTLYECDGAGRQESIYVDDNLIAGPEDLGDGQIHQLSLRLDPALYADHAISVTIAAPGIDGAVVSEVNLHDIDYRYADAGGSNDPEYAASDTELPFGWLDGVANTGWGTLPYQSVRVNQLDDELTYRFDALDPAKNYRVHMTFWLPSGTGRIQRVEVDGLDAGLTVDTSDYQLHSETIDVPLAAYQADGAIDVTIRRLIASSGAMINEIALEEETLFGALGCVVPETPYFSDVYGYVTMLGEAAPVGSVVQAVNPRGDVVGCFVTTDAGQYGFMRIYGEDTTVTPAIPGMRDGEIVEFYVNGAQAVSTPLLTWYDDHGGHQVDLDVGTIEGQSILFETGYNFFSFRGEPPVPTVPRTLSSIEGRYSRVLGETGVYVPTLPPVFNTLHELHPGLGYYVYITGTTSINGLLEGVTVPVTTPLQLHAGWNWAGYLPEATLPITVALASIEGQYDRVLSLDKTYDPALPQFSTLLEMTPGEGYMIHTTDAVTLTYPADAGLLTAPPKADAPSPCANVAPTPYGMLVFGEVLVNGEPAPTGTRVEIVTPAGDVAGCALVQKRGILGFTHVFGADDTVAPAIPGFQEGDTLVFRVNGVDVDADLVTWRDDWSAHQVTLEADLTLVYLPVVLRGR